MYTEVKKTATFGISWSLTVQISAGWLQNRKTASSREPSQKPLNSPLWFRNFSRIAIFFWGGGAAEAGVWISAWQPYYGLRSLRYGNFIVLFSGHPPVFAKPGSGKNDISGLWVLESGMPRILSSARSEPIEPPLN